MERDVPVDVWGVFRKSWEMFKKGWGQYVLTMLIIYVPAFIITGALALSFGLRYWPTPGTGLTNIPVGGVIGAAGLIAVVGMILSALESAAVVSLFRMQWDGERLNWQVAIARGWPLVGAVIGASLLIALATLIGFILLVVPGIIVAFLLSLTIQAVVFDRLPVFSALKASYQATVKAILSVLAVVVVQAVLSWALARIFRGTGDIGSILNAIGDLFIGTWAVIALGLCYLQGSRAVAAPSPAGAGGPGPVLPGPSAPAPEPPSTGTPPDTGKPDDPGNPANPDGTP